MPNISKITTPNGTSYDIKDSSAIANISRSGTTYTATRRNGTSFTFTQAPVSELPVVSSSDAGKVLVVDSTGHWVSDIISNAEDLVFYVNAEDLEF